jgi:predicted amidohydrolase
MSICYDLRFPELYRSLINLGAELLAVPSAFTYETGKDHWFPLLKSRAIENLAYLIAPAQTGTAYPGRHCYGNSLILDPWGNVLAHRPEESAGVIFAEINHDYQRHIRQRFPVLKHRKLFTERL